MIRLTGNKIAVTPILPPDLTASGLLYIPEQSKDRCKQGIVKYVGPDVKSVGVGDYVIFGAYTGTLIKIQDELLIIFLEEFAEAVLSEVPNTEIYGLYFRDSDGKYFQATYEMAMDLIARGVQEAPWYAAFERGMKELSPIKSTIK